MFIRAADKYGIKVNFLLLAKSNNQAAKNFFKSLIKQHGKSYEINIDKGGAKKVRLDTINMSKISVFFLSFNDHL